MNCFSVKKNVMHFLIQNASSKALVKGCLVCWSAESIGPFVFSPSESRILRALGTHVFRVEFVDPPGKMLHSNL